MDRATPRQLEPQSAERCQNKPRRHQCRYCKKNFTRADHRARHERSHTKETPYACRHCAKSFGRKDLLVRHNKILHRDTAETDDEASFSQESDKFIHVKPVSNGAGVKWYTWQPKKDNSSRPRQGKNLQAKITAQEAQSDPAAVRNPHRAVTVSSEPHLGVGVDSAEIATVDEPFIQEDLPYEVFPFEVDPSMDGVTQQGESHVLSNQLDSVEEPVYNDQVLDSVLMEQPLEPDWITNFDFSAATYSSVFQTALPLWPTLDWSPSSLIEVAESPKSDSENLQRTLPTPGVAQHGHFRPDQPGGSLSLLDRVFTTTSTQIASNGQPSTTGQRQSYFTSESRAILAEKLAKYQHVLPPKFLLPSYHALNRYASMYFLAGARHQPFIHEPTWNSGTCNLGLLLALCAMGARYCFEISCSRRLWTAGRSILRCNMDDADQVSDIVGEELCSDTDLLENCQGLLLLTMYATWAGEKHLTRQALAFQSVLATLIREIRPRKPRESRELSWETWVQFESHKRLKFVVLCFVNLQCLVYDLPTLIHHNEFDLELPCGEEVWRAETESTWRQRVTQDVATPSFLSTIRMLLNQDVVSASQRTEESTREMSNYSMFGNYILINGLTQYSAEQRRHEHRDNDNSFAASKDRNKTFERALRRWQKGWERHPKASLDPQDPHGPLAFNCTALLRIAYIRLDMDFAPYAAALRSGDAELAADTIYNQPAIARSRRSMRAALHAWHALLIPIRMGIDLVAETQVFLWSIQHFIASFECCLQLAKWLDTVTVTSISPSLTSEECWLIKLVQETLLEAGVDEDVGDIRMLSVSVLRTWARLFCANRIWGFIPLIGAALTRFADLLCSRLQEVEQM